MVEDKPILDTRKRNAPFFHPNLKKWNHIFKEVIDDVTPLTRENLRDTLLQFTTFSVIKGGNAIFLRSPKFVAYLRGFGNRIVIEYMEFKDGEKTKNYKFWVYRNKMSDLSNSLNKRVSDRVDRVEFLNRLFNWE